ncbi:sigma-70 family RNA polymerase sigma factor [Natranaerobius thermophilus]|uniref:RNA polymerase, sigma 28 subunit, FliA/WhiG family n=1 Tax=Natranaerobius thermophilus (strain ATCC BAA-1301 / DSM 18059 / JW/NM-WN-LF) TaxID=457570 RepID=B2A4Z3_NATTJ|nr:sigma-70 family RNA polymerase sigma factor [Natranaerobius thermophilus]ACB85235.1 RNA polymerase, sigma 28 subunit, FliA/WhiG family [Natranaerobius thermophilus JW/NM-WN-LF]
MRANTHKYHKATDNTIELIKKWQQKGDREARKIIIEENINLVKSVVKRFVGSGIEEEDLTQLGLMGLIKAIDKFDYRKEVRFSTYAVPLIIGEIKTFLRDDHPIKVSRNLKELFNRSKEVKRWLTLKLRREPTISEVADELEVSKEELATAEEANQELISLDKPVSDEHNHESEKALIDTIPDNSFDAKIHNELTIQELLKKLDQKKRRLIVLRYFLEKSQQETGVILGMSQVQVSRMERRILNNLQRDLIDN